MKMLIIILYVAAVSQTVPETINQRGKGGGIVSSIMLLLSYILCSCYISDCIIV